MARAGDHGYWSPTLTIIRLVFNIPDVNKLSNSLIFVKSLGVMEFVLSLARRIFDFSITSLLITMCFKCCLYFTTLFVFVG